MSHSTDRRGFLVSALAGAGAAALAPDAAHAIDPIARTQGHHFKLSLAAYSYRAALTNGSLKLVDFIDDCAKFGLAGTELTSYYFPETPTEEYLRQIKAEAFRRGLDVSGTAVRNDFCLPPGQQRDDSIAHVKRWIEYADKMDAPVIRIFSGNIGRGQTQEQANRLTIAAIEECCDYAGKYGVYLALENHDGLTTDPENMLAIVRAVNSPWFGVNMDTGNFRTADVYGDLAKIAPYSLNVQVKVVIRPTGRAPEQSDFGRLAQILKDAGYRGYIVLEFEEAGDPREECRRYLDLMRQAFV